MDTYSKRGLIGRSNKLSSTLGSKSSVPVGFPGAPINVVQILDAESLLFFLQCLTHQRVLHEQGPFDHPSINIPNGFEGNDPTKETVLTIGEVGTNGGTPPSQFPSSKSRLRSVCVVRKPNYPLKSEVAAAKTYNIP
jgi:hypothetical protein